MQKMAKYLANTILISKTNIVKSYPYIMFIIVSASHKHHRLNPMLNQYMDYTDRDVISPYPSGMKMELKVKWTARISNLIL